MPKLNDPIQITVDGPTPWKMFFEGKIKIDKVIDTVYRNPIDAAVQEGINAIEREMLVDFKSTAEGWSDPPVFISVPSLEKNSKKFTIFVTGAGERKWIWVNYGTKKHPIAVSMSGKKMPIRSYTSKTSPGKLGANPGGGAYGAIRAMSEAVIHPGITARRFDELITIKYSAGDKAVANRVSKAISKIFGKKR